MKIIIKGTNTIDEYKALYQQMSETAEKAAVSKNKTIDDVESVFRDCDNNIIVMFKE